MLHLSASSTPSASGRSYAMRNEVQSRHARGELVNGVNNWWCLVLRCFIETATTSALGVAKPSTTTQLDLRSSRLVVGLVCALGLN